MGGLARKTGKQIILGLVQFAVLVLFCLNPPPSTAQIVKRTCVTDPVGTRSCTEYFLQRKPRRYTDRIMGMSARKYIRGLRQGRCMPSPSGACGGE
jgi:hypothetical protein